MLIPQEQMYVMWMAKIPNTMKKRNLSPFIYSLATLVILLALVLVGRSFAPDRVQITILSTTDLHGNINPIDYYTNKQDNRGLAKVATLIKRVRKEQPNVLLIDSGDTIQGSPLESFHAVSYTHLTLPTSDLV